MVQEAQRWAIPDQQSGPFRIDRRRPGSNQPTMGGSHRTAMPGSHQVGQGQALLLDRW